MKNDEYPEAQCLFFRPGKDGEGVVCPWGGKGPCSDGWENCSHHPTHVPAEKEIKPESWIAP